MLIHCERDMRQRLCRAQGCSHRARYLFIFAPQLSKCLLVIYINETLLSGVFNCRLVLFKVYLFHTCVVLSRQVYY